MFISLLTLVIVVLITSTVHSHPLTSTPDSSLASAATNQMLNPFTPVPAGQTPNEFSFGRLILSCFSESGHPHLPKLQQIKRPDCYMLFFLLLSGDTAATPYRWDWKKDARPKVYSYGTCLVAVYAAIPSAVDTLTELAVARAAALVVKSCVTAPKGWLGGRTPVGLTKSFWVTVEGPNAFHPALGME